MKYDVVIVGAGIMGASAAYYLSKTKKRVLLLEQFSLRNNKNASSDYSRVFRYEYGRDELYTRLAVKSLKLWKELEITSGKQLYFQTGALLLGEKENDYAMDSYLTLKTLGYPVEYLEKRELEKKYPQIRAGYGVFDHYGGILDAYEAVRILIQLAEQNGVVVRDKVKVEDVHSGKLILDKGESVTFNTVILTTGAWTKQLLGDRFPIRPTKQQVLYLEPNDKDLFSKEVFPAFAYLDKGFYGVPKYGIPAVKLASHLPGDVVDPNALGDVDEEFVGEARTFLKKYIPALERCKVVASKVCLYDMTPDSDFIIDRIENDIVVATGFSGHGFKFAPLIGKILAELVIAGETVDDISRFKLSRFSSIMQL